jgi:cytochrome P450
MPKANFLWRPFDQQYIEDPYAMYKILREQDPVHEAQTKEFIITRYNDVKEILKSPSFESGNRLEWLKRGVDYFKNKDEDFRPIYEAMNSFILMLNGAEHLRLRNFISKAWNSREVDELISKNIDFLMTTYSSKQMDVVKEFAQPLPVLTIASILGISIESYDYLKDLGLTMTKSLDLYVSLKDLVELNHAAQKFISFFQDQLQYKKANPDKGLLSKLIQKNESENAGLTDRELTSISIFLFIAGEETSSSLISNSILTLLKNPESLAQIQNDAALIEPAIEEVLRYDSTVQLLGRIAKNDYQLGGKKILAGASVTLVVGSANQDETVFENADRFNMHRANNRHLAFGSGVHFCLGDWLARKQAQLAVLAFFQKFPRVSLAEQQLSWHKNLAIRNLKSLMVNFS